jgi:hypothetical protein
MTSMPWGENVYGPAVICSCRPQGTIPLALNFENDCQLPVSFQDGLPTGGNVEIAADAGARIGGQGLLGKKRLGRIFLRVGVQDGGCDLQLPRPSIP